MDLAKQILTDYRLVAIDFFQLLMVTLAFIMSLPEYRRNKRGEYLYLIGGLCILIIHFGINTLVNSYDQNFLSQIPSLDLLGSFLEATGLVLITHFFLIAAFSDPPSILRWGRTMMMGIIGVTALFTFLQLAGLIHGIEGWAIVGRPTFRMILLAVICLGFFQMTRGETIPYRALAGFFSLAIAHTYHLFYYPSDQVHTLLQSIYPWPYLFNPMGYFLLVVAVDHKIACDQGELSNQLKHRQEELEHATTNLTKLNRLSTNLLRTTELRGIIRMILDAINLDLGYRNSMLFITDRETSSLRGFKISNLTGAPVSYPSVPIPKKTFLIDCFLQSKPSFFGEGHPQASGEFIRDYEFSASIVTVPLLTKKEHVCFELKDCNLKSCPIKGWDLNICWMMTDDRCPCHNPDETVKISQCLKCQSFNLVGMIVIDNRTAKVKVDEKNVAFLETFANQAGLALQSAFLVEDLSKESTLRTETLKNLPVGVIVLKPNGRIHEFNDAMAQITGIEETKALGSHYSSVKIIDDAKTFNEHIKAILDNISSGKGEEITTHNLTVKSKIKIVNVQLRPIFKNQALNGLIIMVEDVTSMKELEKQLIKSEALAGMGQLAMGIAHEINNPIAGVSGVLQVLSNRFTDESQEKKAINQARNDLKRASNIIKDLLNFAKPSPPARKWMDLNKLIEDAVAFIPYQPGGDAVTVLKDLDEKLPLVFIDPDQFQQVLTNLILNAISAVSEKGGEEAIIEFSTWMDKSWFYLQVEDNGMGIKPENLSHIFEPFFTTKRSGKGTGLGLSLCDRIINDHGGIISARSQPGKGTSFLIKLPRKQN